MSARLRENLGLAESLMQNQKTPIETSAMREPSIGLDTDSTIKIKQNDPYLVGDNHLVLRVLPGIGTEKSQGPRVLGSGFYCMPSFL